MKRNLCDAATLVDLLHGRAREHPARVAVSALREGERLEETWTYAELDARARGVAARLRAAGAGGNTAVLFYPNGLRFVEAFLGCLYAGVIAVPAAMPYRRRHLDRLAATVEAAAPALALSTQETAERMAPHVPGSALEQVPWLATDGVASTHRALDTGISPRGDDLALLQFTSGSTSQPKGVMVRHRNLMANAAIMKAELGQEEDCVIISWLPLFHDMGLMGTLLQALYVGGHCVLMSPEAFIMKPVRWLRAISQYRAHTSGGPNFAYELCTRKVTTEQMAGLDLSSWRCAFNGSEPLSAATLARFSERFSGAGFRSEMHLPVYGLAEATLYVTGKPKGSAPVVLTVCAGALEAGIVQPATKGSLARTLVSCGRSPMGGEVRVVDPATSIECPEGRVGEVWTHGPQIAAGYWRLPEETGRTFGAKLADQPAQVFLRTGDLGFLRGGELFVTGRMKDLIIVAGRNLYPTDLERTVEDCHYLIRLGSTVAFSVLEDEEERLVLAAEVERTVPGSEQVREVEEAIRRAIVEEHLASPSAILLLPPGGIPRTTSGKVQRGACREAFLAGTLGRESTHTR